MRTGMLVWGVVGLVPLLALLVGVRMRMTAMARTLEEMHRRQAEGRVQRLVQNASDLITICDVHSTIHYQTPSVEPILGWRAEELVGTRLADLIHPEDRARLAVLLPGAEEAAADPMECRIRRKDGTFIVAETIGATVDEAGVRSYVLTTRDVTDRKALEQQLVHQSFHDALTGLANRALFVNRVQHALQRRSSADQPLAVVILDIDDFKDVNDALSHGAGDELLKIIADRLRGRLRAADTVARLGGDEFALLFDEVPEVQHVTRLAERLIEAVRVPLVLNGRRMEINASVGVALADPDRAQEAEELLRNAELAMYRAKREGKDRVECFVPSMHSRLLERLELNADLRRAVERGELAVHHQPIVELGGGRIVGVEALARWHHPSRGPISPAEFIPLAEASGLILPIGRFVLEQACLQAARWRERFPGTPLNLNVNLSVHQLRTPGIVDEVAQVLRATGVAPGRLTLEITESALADDRDLAAARLQALKQLGVRIAIDDFGTGYSSLSRLGHFPIDILKIPKPFVDGILQGPENAALARAIIELAAGLGLAVVAEGIEDRGQWHELRRLGCELGQGFHFARPIGAEQIDAMLRHGDQLPPVPSRAALAPRS